MRNAKVSINNLNLSKRCVFNIKTNFLMKHRKIRLQKIILVSNSHFSQSSSIFQSFLMKLDIISTPSNSIKLLSITTNKEFSFEHFLFSPNIFTVFHNLSFTKTSGNSLCLKSSRERGCLNIFKHFLCDVRY
jgi:hypothetical protein